jgi:hypothetical protein
MARTVAIAKEKPACAGFSNHLGESGQGTDKVIFSCGQNCCQALFIDWINGIRGAEVRDFFKQINSFFIFKSPNLKRAMHIDLPGIKTTIEVCLVAVMVDYKKIFVLFRIHLIHLL